MEYQFGPFRLNTESFVMLPYVPNAGSMLCDMIRTDGKPWEACPRSFLKRMIAQYGEQGMRAEAAVEHEFYFARKEGDKYVPADDSLCYSSRGLDDEAEVVDAILAALELEGV